jgi:hypothetical protein
MPTLFERKGSARTRYPRGNTPVVDELELLVSSRLARRLDHLSITRATGSDAVCRALAGMRQPSLRELDLSDGDLSDEGAELLAASEWQLDIIDVTRNRLTPRGVAALGRIAKLVVAEHQRR